MGNAHSWRIQPSAVTGPISMKPRFLIPWRVTFEKKAGWNPYIRLAATCHQVSKAMLSGSPAAMAAHSRKDFPTACSEENLAEKGVGWVNFLKDLGREKTLLDFWIHDHLARASNDVSSFKWIEACYHFRHLRIYLSNYLIVPCLIYLVHLHYLYLHLIIVKVDESRLSFQHILNMNQPLWSPGAFNFHRRGQLVEVPMKW